MEITRQADYALRTVYYLAQIGEGQRASTSLIAKEKKIPHSFLAKIISQLSVSRIIYTLRGAKGGVSIARSPDKITMLEVVEAIDGKLKMNDCVINPESCPFGKNCPLHEVWCKAQVQLMNTLRSTTFADLVKNGK